MLRTPPGPAPKQREAIYDDVVHDLTGIGDIFLTLDRGDIEAAQRMRLRYEADLRLLDDLGWHAHDSREQVTLTMSPVQLARQLCHLAAISAARLYDSCQPSDQELARAEHQAAVTSAAYSRLLDELNRPADHDR